MHGPTLPSDGFLGRLKSHKVIEWTLAYAALAYTLLHGVQMIAESLEWPHVIARVLTLALILGVPVIATFAWYQGARGLKRISGPELAILTVLLLIAGSVLWAFSGTPSEHEREKAEHDGAAISAASATSAAGETALPPAAPRSAVAVLPFANLTGDVSNDYLGDGMAEELINFLAKAPGLRVPARTSSFAYKGRNADIRQIARDLGVGSVVEGSVRAAGKRIRVTAQLINAQDGLHLWSETYDEEFTDIFKLQDKLAAAIATKLQSNLRAGATPQGAATAQTTDVEAYQLVLQGSALVTSNSPANIRLARGLFQQAIQRDPKFVRAWSGLSSAYLISSFYQGEPEQLSEAENAGEMTLTLDSRSGEAHSTLAFTSLIRGRWAESVAHDRAALDADSSDAMARVRAAWHLSAAGRLREAQAMMNAAYSLAPATPTVVLGRATVSWQLGMDDKAGADVALARRLGQSDTFLPLGIESLLARRAGRYAEATDIMLRGLDPQDAWQTRYAQVVRLVNAALADASKRSAALAARAQIWPSRDAGDGLGGLRYSIFCAASAGEYVRLNAIDDAYALADQCVEQASKPTPVPAAFLNDGGSMIGGYSLWSAEMRPFRVDRRFQSFVTRLGLLDYWKQSGPPDSCDLKDGRLACR